MTEENTENLDSQNQEEAEDTSETSTEETTSTNDELEELRSKNSQLLARAKKAEEKAKREEAARLLLEKSKTGNSEPIDFLEVAKRFSNLKDYSSEELEIIGRHAKVLGVEPEEAAKNEEVQLVIKARREKVLQENNTPSPTSKQAPSEKSFFDYSPEDIRSGKMSMEEVDKFREWARNN